jgi:hypothetical protein
VTAATNPFNDFVFVNATPADRGSFTLALDKALDKLEKFQLPDPSYFILQWIQALVASGATNLNITLETNSFLSQYDLRIIFDGPGYTARELQGLYDHVFLSGRDRGQDRLRELALGWLSANSLKPARLAISSNGWIRLRDKSSAVGKTGEVTTQNVNSAPGHAMEISGRGSFDFEQMLTARCTDVPIPLFLNGTQISHPTVATGVPWPNRPFSNGPTKGVMGATYGAGSTSQIAFLRYGVNFVSRSEPALVPPVILRVSDSTLSKNVSQTDVVKDEAYDEFLARLRSEMKAMGLSLAGKRIPSYQRDSLNRYLQSYIASHLDIRALEDPKRLALLGADYESLLNYPVFASNKAIYRSLTELHSIYKKQGSLLYCLDPQARAISWAGVLLVLEPEEVAVLRKFFPNLVGLPIETVRSQSRMGRSTLSAEVAGDAPVLARRELRCGSRYYHVTCPDCYPTGTAVLMAKKGKFGTAIPGLPLTLTVEYLDTKPPNHTHLVNLQRAIVDQLPSLKEELALKVSSSEGHKSFSRSRAAELLCEMLNFEIANASSEPDHAATASRTRFLDVPLIGLEDGRLVSLSDINTFLRLVPQVYVGGAFVEGLASGALDPMPEASKLLHRLYPPHQLIPTERIRPMLADHPELRFQLRRQAVMRGIGLVADPLRALEQFASEAALEAAELARIEQEYRQALEGPTLFVKPDEQRLAQLATLDDDSDLPLLDLTATASPAISATVSLSDLPKAEVKIATGIPSLESDMELCRQRDPDLFPERDSLHVERRESNFTLHLATCQPGQGKLWVLRGDDCQSLNIPQPVRGFLRSPASDPDEVRKIFQEGLEQLTIKAMHAFNEGPPSGRLRRALRLWLLHRSCGDHERLLASESRRHDLFDLAVVPCLGDKFLSWRTLLEQAQRVGETVVHEGLPDDVAPSPNREVILLAAPVTSVLLSGLSFPDQRPHIPEKTAQPFEALYRSTRRDLASVLSGQSTPLLQTNLVEQLASDASLWQRWRSGFLSWDRDQSVVVMNPGHKIGKKLAQRFSDDPTWSRIFASALFSTINRGLEEVEDRHERTFLEALVETLD